MSKLSLILFACALALVGGISSANADASQKLDRKALCLNSIDAIKKSLLNWYYELTYDVNMYKSNYARILRDQGIHQLSLIEKIISNSDLKFDIVEHRFTDKTISCSQEYANLMENILVSVQNAYKAASYAFKCPPKKNEEPNYNWGESNGGQSFFPQYTTPKPTESGPVGPFYIEPERKPIHLQPPQSGQIKSKPIRAPKVG